MSDSAETDSSKSAESVGLPSIPSLISVNPDKTHDYYECPECGEPICSFTDCPSCDNDGNSGWYDQNAWQQAVSIANVESDDVWAPEGALEAAPIESIILEELPESSNWHVRKKDSDVGHIILGHDDRFGDVEICPTDSGKWEVVGSIYAHDSKIDTHDSFEKAVAHAQKLTSHMDLIRDDSER